MKKLLISLGVTIVLILFGYNLILYSQLKEIKNNSYLEEISLLEKQYKELSNQLQKQYNLNSIEEVENLMSNLIEEKELLSTENQKLENNIISLSEQKETLTKQYNKLVEQKKDNEQFIIEGVKTINQYNIGYPTGCESVALTILLNYWNISVDTTEIVNILKKGKKPYYENGIKYGGNPYLEFIGDPKDSHSFGVYDEPIKEVANQFKPGIISATGKSLDEILNIVKENRPVIVWNSMHLAVPYISTSWIYKETGETISWLANEHAIVIVGFTDNKIITSDSLTGSIRYFDRVKFENRYNLFGKRALYY